PGAPSCRRRISSMTRKPRLCRVAWKSGPGLPRPRRISTRPVLPRPLLLPLRLLDLLLLRLALLVADLLLPALTRLSGCLALLDHLGLHGGSSGGLWRGRYDLLLRRRTDHDENLLRVCQDAIRCALRQVRCPEVV